MKNYCFRSCFAIVVLVAVCCNDPVPGRIRIDLVEHITHNSVVIRSEILDIGKGVGLQFRGVCAHKTSIPGFGDLTFKGSCDDKYGLYFRTGVSGLEPGTRYIFRAYCETNEGIFYSDTFSIRTKPVDFLTDSRDGQRYPVKKFGSETWMVQNLEYLSSGSLTAESDMKAIPPEFGRLYSYPEALVVCPSGWHLPSDKEWKALEETCGVPAPELDNDVNRGIPAGGKMKEPGSRLWETDNSVFATNESGFSVVPSGWYHPANKEFIGTWSGAGYWSEADSSQKIWGRFFYSSSEGISRLGMNPVTGFYSVRCVKD